MAGNYNNIDLANKMECISIREYLLSSLKILYIIWLKNIFIKGRRRMLAVYDNNSL